MSLRMSPGMLQIGKEETAQAKEVPGWTPPSGKPCGLLLWQCSASGQEGPGGLGW